MHLGETLKKLRRQKDMTQEQLAEYLNISTQAVSRWETNASLPDITLIPMLANIFDTSADILLGIDITAKEKRIEEIIKHSGEYTDKGYREKSAEILRGGLKEYPNSYRIMAKLMSAVWGMSYKDRSQEERTELRKEVIKLGEKVLAESTDDDCRYNAIQLLCYTYRDVGEPEKAKALAEKMPDSCLSHERLLQHIYSGDNKFRQYKDVMMSELDSLVHDMKYRHTLDDGDSPHTKEEYIFIYKKVIAIIEIMIEDGNYGFLRQRVGWTYIDIAQFYAQLEDYDNSIENLKLAAKHSIIYDEEYNPDDEYTSLLFKGKKFGGISHNTTVNDSMNQLEEMKNPAFDPIRERKEFIEIEEKLKKYAKNR